MEMIQPKKSGIRRFLDGIGSGIRRFIVSFLFAVTGTLVFTVWTLLPSQLSFFEEEFGIFELIATGVGMSTAACLQILLEGSHAKRAKLWEVLVSVPLSAAAFFLLYCSRDAESALPTQLNSTFTLIIFGLILFSVLSGMAVLARRSPEGAAVRSAVFGIFWAQILFGITTSAFLVFYLAIDTLIVSVHEDVPLFILVFSFLCVAMMVFLSFLPKPGENRPRVKAYSILFTYVLTPLFLVLLLILYTYILRVIISFKMPSGEMNPFGMAALAAFLILWLTLKGEESAFARWFCRYGGLFVLPVTVMQIIGLWIRIHAYGLTPLRTASIFLILLGLLGILYSVLRLSSAVFFRTAAVLVLVAMVTPLNVFQISNLEQGMRLKAVLDRYEMILPDGSFVPPSSPVSEADRAKIISGFSYFRYADGVLSGFEKAVQKQEDAYDLIGHSSSDPDPWVYVPYDSRLETYRFTFRKSGTFTENPLLLEADTKLYYIPELDADDEIRAYWTDPDSGDQIDIDLISIAKQLVSSAKESESFDETAELLFPIDERHTLLVTDLWISYRAGEESFTVEAEGCWMLVHSTVNESPGGATP